MLCFFLFVLIGFLRWLVSDIQLISGWLALNTEHIYLITSSSSHTTGCLGQRSFMILQNTFFALFFHIIHVAGTNRKIRYSQHPVLGSLTRVIDNQCSQIRISKKKVLRKNLP